MSFTSRDGTRGNPLPTSRVMRWRNARAARLIKKRDGTFLGMNLLVLTTIGKKSGQARETPVRWFPGPDDSWIIVASAAGAAKNPSWYYNLAAHPDRVSIALAGKTITVSAEQLHGEARSAVWARSIAGSRRFRHYEAKTDRELPIIRLVRREP